MSLVEKVGRITGIMETNKYLGLKISSCVSIIIGSLVWVFLMCVVTYWDDHLWLKIFISFGGFLVYMMWRSWFMIDWNNPYGNKEMRK